MHTELTYYQYAIIYQPLAYFDLLLPFIIGVIMNKWAERRCLKMKLFERHHALCLVFLLALITIKCCSRIMIFDSLYSFFFIILLINLPLNNIVGKFFILMGKYSMPMWMIHTFFYSYFFHDFIYGFKYPVIIFAVVVLISYLCSIPIIKVSNWTWKMVAKRDFSIK